MRDGASSLLDRQKIFSSKDHLFVLEKRFLFALVFYLSSYRFNWNLLVEWKNVFAIRHEMNIFKFRLFMIEKFMFDRIKSFVKTIICMFFYAIDFCT